MIAWLIGSNKEQKLVASACLVRLESPQVVFFLFFFVYLFFFLFVLVNLTRT